MPPYRNFPHVNSIRLMHIAHMFAVIGHAIARYLSKTIDIRCSAPPANPLHLQEILQPGDVLLVEGNSRVSTAIKYLTQSTWSHAALYVGSGPCVQVGAPEDHCFVEADMVHGVRTSGLERFVALHTRICRPFGLTSQEQQQIAAYAISQVGHRYDLSNLLDLARYLLPVPPVPTRWRRRMLSVASGEPTRAICSTLIAKAFSEIRYPVLPQADEGSMRPDDWRRFLGLAVFIPIDEKLIVPRDFDVSPFFDIVKPTLVSGFNHRDLEWVAQKQ